MFFSAFIDGIPSLTKIPPWVGIILPTIRLNSVVFPLPLFPVIKYFLFLKKTLLNLLIVLMFFSLYLYEVSTKFIAEIFISLSIDSWLFFNIVSNSVLSDLFEL